MSPTMPSHAQEDKLINQGEAIMSKQETIDKCRNGHPKSDSYIASDGMTVCRTCRYNRIRSYRVNRRKELISGGIL
jgi:hypothetical protein